MHLLIDRRTLRLVGISEELYPENEDTLVVESDVPFDLPRVDPETGIEISGTQFLPAEVEELRWSVIRRQRNQRLAACDWTQLTDNPLTEEQRNAWALYRQKLRNLPQKFATPDQVVWPEEP